MQGRKPLERAEVAVIADSHLGGPGSEAEPFLEDLREVARRGCKRLVLLGDIFQVWVGSRRFETPEVRAVVEGLSALHASGVRIDYIEGNRDFFLDGSPYAHLFDSLGLELSFEAGGKRYLAVHGDGLNRADRQYLFWRWLSKSRLSRFLALNLPGPIARWAMGSTEQRLSRTNFKHKRRLPEEAITDYGRARLGADYDVLLLGHFHQDHRFVVEGGEVHILEAWFHKRHIEWLG